jgi:hypothetical protein
MIIYTLTQPTGYKNSNYVSSVREISRMRANPACVSMTHDAKNARSQELLNLWRSKSWQFALKTFGKVNNRVLIDLGNHLVQWAGYKNQHYHNKPVAETRSINCYLQDAHESIDVTLCL